MKKLDKSWNSALDNALASAMSADISTLTAELRAYLYQEIQGADMPSGVKNAILNNGIAVEITSSTTAIISVMVEKVTIYANAFPNTESVNLAALYNYGWKIGKDAFYYPNKGSNAQPHWGFYLNKVPEFASHPATNFAQKAAQKLMAKHPGCSVTVG
ncbi:MAG: hypothetical protein E7270_11655 [Lachnospiraceae bacterium]|nr:hypothetical protein [Lachnospiraceae bacterium]